jgi:hypothetical protein
MLTPLLLGVHAERLVTGFRSPYVALIAFRMVSHRNLLAAKASNLPAGIANDFNRLEKI